MQYPDYYGADPRPDLPSELAPQIDQIMVRAVVNYRANRKECEILDAAITMYKLLSCPRLQESHAVPESIQDALKKEAALALKCALWIYRQGGGGRVPSAGTTEWVSTTAIFEFREMLASKLAEFVDADVTEWWRRQLNPSAKTQYVQPAAVCAGDAETKPPLASTPSEANNRPRNRRAKDTPTARNIEQFRRRIEDEGRRDILSEDMAYFMGYADISSLQCISREAKNASKASKRAFKRLLQCPSAEEFWRVVELNRQNLQKKRKT